MEDEPMQIDVPTSPDLPTQGDMIASKKAFSDAMTLDLSDEEIEKCMTIIMRIRNKHMMRFRQKFNDIQNFTVDDALRYLSEFEDELRTTLAEEAHVLATVDSEPVIFGDPPVIEWLGVLPGGSLDRYGTDHEKKTWEVQRANERGESYLGEKKS